MTRCGDSPLVVCRYINIFHEACLFFFLLVHKFFYNFSTNISDMFFIRQRIVKLDTCNFSHLLICMSYSLTLLLMASLELTNKWHLSALLFNKLFSNHSNKAFDAFSKDPVTPLMSSTITYQSIIICIVRDIDIV